ncbi:MAG: hypothetical protein DI603_00680 [Roseateles depolymerans]|uniref:Uncharacterized protein n=1 Tax=Roseateles depolymerans TaxID=76731 RepID=A0A2W5FTT8_9BURK|nr:MAG: hypothetical protein DI603_00680 [Roseateles depolymerans]
MIAAPDLPASGTAISLSSAADDPIGKGRTLSYTQASARIQVTRTNDVVQLSSDGDDRWSMNFRLGSLPGALKAGEYKDLPEFVGSASNGFSWNQETPIAGCSARVTTLVVDRVVFDGETLSELGFSFEQRCSSTLGPLRGRVRWLASDTSRGPGPVQPVPSNLWAPNAGSTPANGNYVYLESSTGDVIGAGKTYLHTLADTVIIPTLAGPSMNFIVRGDSYWFGRFLAMDSQSRVQVGYYADLQSYQRRNPRKGGFEWVQPSLSCDFRGRSWVAVDAAQYKGDVLSMVELRFEQRCQDGSAPPLRGKIRWSIDDATRPAGPVFPVPAGLWQAAAGDLPAGGNYVYLEGEAGEWISQGQKLAITPAQFPLLVFDKAGELQVRVGDQVPEWSGSFKVPYNRGKLERGYYGNLLSTAFGNPAKGGLGWSGKGRGCDATGWFAVDDVAYTHGELRRLDLRFEQACAGTGKRMHGRIHWTSADPVVLENRIDEGIQGFAPPAPPSPLAPPAAGSYILLDSGADDYIGAGGAYLYTALDASLSVTVMYNVLQVKVDGNEHWLGRFAKGHPAVPIGPGSYTVTDSTSPAVDAASQQWSGEARGCSQSPGSFTIDRIENSANGVQALDLRFEQYCDGSYTPLRGQIHWVANDSVQPPGPVWPAPQELWRLPASQVPGSGNYFYAHSAPGGFVGDGSNHLLTSADSEFILTPTTGGGLDIRIVGKENWSIGLTPMLPLMQLQPGYYGDLSSNPAHGLMSLGGNYRGCNRMSGWFVIDAVSYEGGQISSLDLRAGQLCERQGPPLFVQLRWRR